MLIVLRGIVDSCLLHSGPLLGARAWRWLSRQRGGSQQRSGAFGGGRRLETKCRSPQCLGPRFPAQHAKPGNIPSRHESTEYQSARSAVACESARSIAAQSPQRRARPGNEASITAEYRFSAKPAVLSHDPSGSRPIRRRLASRLSAEYEPAQSR